MKSEENTAPLTKAEVLVSIIMPAFNANSTITGSINSVLAQTHTNWELLVVDDLSTDNTCDIVAQFAARDERIRLIRHATNSGVAQARNTALASTNNPFVAFLDSDDLWMPEKLEKQTRFMASRNCAISYTAFRRFDDLTGRLSDVIEPPASLNYEQLLRNSAIACLTVMVDRRLIGEFGFSRIRHEDFALWLKVLRQGITAQCLQADLARYRVSSHSLSSNKFKSTLWVWRVYRLSEKLSLLKSLHCFSQYVVRAIFKRLPLRTKGATA